MPTREDFRKQTIRLLCHKYRYYVLDNPVISDQTYDTWERRWHELGRSLGELTAEETSPCTGFDAKHPLAQEAIQIARCLEKK